MDSLYTIGHSNHPIDVFVGLLIRHQIGAVVDVRSHPYSQMNPQYNRENLRSTLKEQGIAYVYLGRELGARRTEDECYVGDQARYDRIMRQPLFREGIERVLKGLEQYRVAIMCAEKDPLDCHRFILIGRYLRDCSVQVLNILEDGAVESMEQSERRLLEKTATEPDLFNWDQPVEERILQAYEKRAQAIAYRKAADAI